MERRRDMAIPPTKQYGIMELLLKTNQVVTSKSLRITEYTAYQSIKRNNLQYKLIFNPVINTNEFRITDGQHILPGPTEVTSIIKDYRRKYLGFGARKLYYKIKESFIGISESKLQLLINSDPDQRRVHTVFDNEAPLKPVESSAVMKIIQIDTVDIKTKFGQLKTDKYRYELVLEDLLSRYQWLRVLETKEADGVALECLEIFRTFGAPVILQSDRGREFLGLVISLCEREGIEMRKSRPRHPQAQGKATHLMTDQSAAMAKNPIDKTWDIFTKMDVNSDGVLSKEEFIKVCLNDETLCRLLACSPNEP